MLSLKPQFAHMHVRRPRFKKKKKRRRTRRKKSDFPGVMVKLINIIYPPPT